MNRDEDKSISVHTAHDAAAPGSNDLEDQQLQIQGNLRAFSKSQTCGTPAQTDFAAAVGQRGLTELQWSSTSLRLCFRVLPCNLRIAVVSYRVSYTPAPEDVRHSK